MVKLVGPVPLHVGALDHGVARGANPKTLAREVFFCVGEAYDWPTALAWRGFAQARGRQQVFQIRICHVLFLWRNPILCLKGRLTSNR
jgi:hypothetical protein